MFMRVITALGAFGKCMSGPLGTIGNALISDFVTPDVQATNPKQELAGLPIRRAPDQTDSAPTKRTALFEPYAVTSAPAARTFAPSAIRVSSASKLLSSI